jgi:hypothetical protein
MESILFSLLMLHSSSSHSHIKLGETPLLYSHLTLPLSEITNLVQGSEKRDNPPDLLQGAALLESQIRSVDAQSKK